MPIKLKSCVRTIKTAKSHGKSKQIWVGLKWRLVDEDARVEAVGPSDIGGRRKLLALKQVVNVLCHQAVGVQEDTFVKIG